MIIARLHRGGLDESMKTARTFESIDEMKQWFCEQNDNAFDVDDVVIEDDTVYDNRTDWNTRHVCTKRWRDEDFVKKYGCPQCIGMCDLEYVER